MMSYTNTKIVNLTDYGYTSIINGDIREKLRTGFKAVEDNMSEKTKPEMKFRAGTITATVWKNPIKDKPDEFMLNTILERSYKDGEEWKTSNSLGKNDLPKAIQVLTKASEFVNGLKQETD